MREEDEDPTFAQVASHELLLGSVGGPIGKVPSSGHNLGVPSGHGMDKEDPDKETNGSLHSARQHGRGPVWNESAGSSLAGSERGDFSDFGDAARFDESIQASSPPMPLLKASPPMPVEGSATDRYAVHIRRACLKQHYGVSFDAAETRDKRLWAITIAEDLPHLGIAKGDQIVTLNRIVPRSVDECREILDRAMAMDLVLQRKRSESLGNRPFPMGKVGGVLLSVSKAVVTDERVGEFRVSMQRSTQRQRFGLVFEPAPPKNRGEDLCIFVADDMPHLALRRGDRLVSLNGVRARSKKVCMQILKTAMNLHLVVRRESGGIPDLTHDLEDIDREELEALKAAAEAQRSAPFLGCMDCADPGRQHEPQHPPPKRGAEGEIIGFDAMGGPLDLGEPPGCCFFSNPSATKVAIEQA